jgi:hypothetical protein
MPNRKNKEAMRAAKQAAARQRDKAARKAELEKEGARLRAKAVENDLAGKPGIVTQLPPLSVRQRKLQSAKGNDGKDRVFSKGEIVARRKNVVIPKKNV